MTALFDDLIRTLDGLLDAERRALLSGDLDALSRLYDQKAALIDAINANESIEADALRALRGKLGRNQALLNSALEGIRAVANRLAETRQVRQTLSTYDQSGKRRQIPGARRLTLEKRA